MSGATADEVEAHDVQSNRTIASEAGPVRLNLGPQLQSTVKDGKEVARTKAQANKFASSPANSHGTMTAKARHIYLLIITAIERVNDAANTVIISNFFYRYPPNLRCRSDKYHISNIFFYR